MVREEIDVAYVPSAMQGQVSMIHEEMSTENEAAGEGWGPDLCPACRQPIFSVCTCVNVRFTSKPQTTDSMSAMEGLVSAASGMSLGSSRDGDVKGRMGNVRERGEREEESPVERGGSGRRARI